MTKTKQRVAVVCEERTEYTLDVIGEVYAPRGVDVYWRRELGVADVWRIFRDHDIVVVNGYTGRIYWLGFLLNAWRFRRTVGVDTDSRLEIPRNPVRRWLKRALLGWLYRRDWCWGLAGGTGTHREAFRAYGMDDRRIVLDPMVSRKRPAGKAPKAPGRFRFGYAGRLVRHKQVDGILAAWRAAAIADSEMTVVGDGPERARLEKKYPEVRFAGKLSGAELSRELAAFDALVLWSAYEPWGLVVNEALAFGVPVIVSDKVGAREDLVDGKGTGIVVDSTDPAGLADAMRRMHSEAATMRENCLKTATKWDMEFHARCWDKWISELP